MTTEKLSKYQHPGIYSAFKSCKKPSLNRLTVSTSKLNRLSPTEKTTMYYKSNGAVNEEYFMEAFDDTPNIDFSSEEINIVLEEIKNDMSTKDKWEKKVEAMKTLRTVIGAFRGKYDSILQRINLLDIYFESSLKDLKSHVIREACITIAFLSMNLQHKFDHFSEVLFTPLMSLIQSSVKVISSSGAICIRFILRSTHNARLLPMLVHHINSKSASLRCAVCEFIEFILCHWKTKFLERHINLLRDIIRLGISDANPDARAFSRQAFWRFIHHFPGQEKLFINSLDASCKRFLSIGMTRSISSLTNSNSLSYVGCGGPVSSKICKSKVQNCEINNINQEKSGNFDSSELRNKEKRLTYSDVIKENHHGNKVCQSMLQKPLNTESHLANSHSGRINEEPTIKNSIILTSSKLKRQNTDIASNFQLTEHTLNKPYDEKCIDNNKTDLQNQCASDKKCSVNDDVSKVIMNLSSTTLKNKVEGLVDLQIFFQSGNTLDIDDLKFVTDVITNILKGDCTDFFGLLLDTLSELLVCHKKDLNYWFDLLLMYILKKFNANIPKHFENRLARVLDVIKGTFPVELQLHSLLRFFKENSCAENINAIAVALNYTYILIRDTELGSDFSTTDLKKQSNIILPILNKITAFAVNENNLKNHSEIQKAAKEALLKLYSLNIPQIKVQFSQMPVEYKKIIQNITSGEINNTATNGINNSSLSSLCVMVNAESQFENNFSENNTMKPDEELKQPPTITTDILDFGCDLCKQEQLSDITTMESLTNTVNLQMKHEHSLKEVCVESKSSPHSESQSLSSKMLSAPYYFIEHTISDQCVPSDILFPSCDTIDQENELICAVLESLNTNHKTEHGVDKCSSLTDKISALNKLMKLSEKTSSFIIRKHFKLILRTLFDYMSATDTTCPVLTLEIVTKMLNRKDITEKFNSYTELLIFQLLLLCTGKNKQVTEKAVLCLNTVAVTLDPDTVIRISVPLAVTSQFPANVAAINVISTLVKSKGRVPIKMYISELMPILIQALDSVEILLRKSALFCIVALYLTVGKESIMHYLTTLDCSKSKLLMMYVQKAKEKQQYIKT